MCSRRRTRTSCSGCLRARPCRNRPLKLACWCTAPLRERSSCRSPPSGHGGDAGFRRRCTAGPCPCHRAARRRRRAGPPPVHISLDRTFWMSSLPNPMMLRVLAMADPCNTTNRRFKELQPDGYNHRSGRAPSARPCSHPGFQGTAAATSSYLETLQNKWAAFISQILMIYKPFAI